MAEMTEEYLPKWEKVAGLSPAFSFILPLINALSKSTRPPLPDSDAGLLRRPLHSIGMRCGLPSCGNQKKVRDENVGIIASCCHALATQSFMV